MSNKKADRQDAIVSLEALRGQTMKRVADIQKSLESKGVSAAVLRGKSDPMGDTGFMGSLILDMILCGSFSVFGTGLTDAFNVMAGGVEGISAVTDEESNSYRRRRLSDYPEGRRRCAMTAAKKMTKKFNMLSANQNRCFSYDVEAELACMFEMLDMLDVLEKEGVSMLRLEPKTPVYGVLKDMTRQLSKKNAIKIYSAPMLKTA